MNPWEEIRLEDYEGHMSLDSVKQLQALNLIIKDQLEAYPVNSVMILGIAGGNGLEYVSSEKYDAVIGVDINKGFLNTLSERYANLSDVLQCLQVDLTKEAEKLPNADLIIANLLIEYIGYDAFRKAVRRVDPKYVSCVIQLNTDEKTWISDSPYLHCFDRLEEVHHQMEPDVLTKVMQEVGYAKILHVAEDLPNGKTFVRLDFQKES